MAEYCSKCAVKFGFKPDKTPLLCEGCGRNIPHLNWLDKIIKLFR